MNRSAPLRRTGFKPRAPAAPAERVRAPLVLVPIRVPAPSAPVFRETPKFPYFRSEALRLACRTLPCQHCSIDDKTIAWSHSNWAIHGHGRNVKASDQFVASMCTRCHTEIDQGSHLSGVERQRIWWNAHRRTVETLVARGLWPADVPVPETHEYPKEWP